MAVRQAALGSYWQAAYEAELEKCAANGWQPIELTDADLLTLERDGRLSATRYVSVYSAQHVVAPAMSIGSAVGAPS